MNRYLGPDFARILAKDNVEYKQANLAVPGSSILFIPPFFDEPIVTHSNRLICLRATGWTGALFACV